MKFIGLILCIATFMLSSCSVELAMQVNKDYSGSMAFKIDISQMLEMIGSFEDSLSQEEIDSVAMDGAIEGFKEAFEEESIAKFKESGITNLKAEMEERKYLVISYDYADINRAYDFFFIADTSATEEQIKELKAVEFFKAGKDRLTIYFNDDGFKDAMKGGMGDEMPNLDEMEGMDMSFMTSMFNIKQSWTFERPIGHVIDDNELPIMVKDNEIFFHANMSDYLENFVDKEITVVFDDNAKKVPPVSNKKKKKRKQK